MSLFKTIFNIYRVVDLVIDIKERLEGIPKRSREVRKEVRQSYREEKRNLKRRQKGRRR